MAIYHLTVKSHNRSDTGDDGAALAKEYKDVSESVAKLKNSVKCAAYRAGCILIDKSSGETFNFSKKTEVVYSDILAPANALPWMLDRESLWSNVEKIEKRYDATLFKEIEVALPIELSHEQHIELIKQFIKDYIVKLGIVVDFSIHMNPGNPHCHMMLSTRTITTDGFGNKNRDWDSKKRLHEWREGWAKVVNAHLKDAGCDVSIDHRSYKNQNSKKKPTRHVGPVFYLGDEITKERLAYNETIKEFNSLLDEEVELKVELSEVNKEIQQQAKITLEEILGSDVANKEYECRERFYKHFKQHYSWRKYYDDISQLRDMEEGANLAFWRRVMRRIDDTHPNDYEIALDMVPEQYRNTFRKKPDATQTTAIQQSMPQKVVATPVQPVESTEQKRRRRKQAPHYSVDRKFFDAVKAGRSETELHDEDRFRALVPHLILENYTESEVMMWWRIRLPVEDFADKVREHLAKTEIDPAVFTLDDFKTFQEDGHDFEDTAKFMVMRYYQLHPVEPQAPVTRPMQSKVKPSDRKSVV